MNVGITGHQKLDEPEAWRWVEDQMREELFKLKPPLVCITSLAIGADQLLARLVLELDGTVHAVLPYENIERSFSSEALEAYRSIALRADIETLNIPGTDEDAYLAAGKRVVDLSDVVFAVWDGLPSRGQGGTADVIAYAVAICRSIFLIDPVTRRISHY